MLILAQPQEIVGADFPGQSKPFRAQPNPFTGDALAFIVVVADCQVFLEVFLCVLEVVLRFGRDHRQTLHGPPAQFVYQLHFRANAGGEAASGKDIL